jgi:beta-lactamase regulating signal transducer with metallopeptidase domain
MFLLKNALKGTYSMFEKDHENSIETGLFAQSVQSTLNKSLDFTSTIARLETRAIAARKRARTAGILLFLGVYGIVGVMFYNLVLGENRVLSESLDAFTDGRQNIVKPFVRRVEHTMSKLIGTESEYDALTVEYTNPSVEEATALKIELKEALTDLEKAVVIAEIGKKDEPAGDSIVPVVSTAVFSLGAVGTLIFTIQLSVMFIRYHLRLGELYDAQSDALRASGGDATLAYALLQH